MELLTQRLVVVCGPFRAFDGVAPGLGVVLEPLGAGVIFLRGLNVILDPCIAFLAGWGVVFLDETGEVNFFLGAFEVADFFGVGFEVVFPFKWFPLVVFDGGVVWVLVWKVVWVLVWELVWVVVWLPSEEFPTDFAFEPEIKSKFAFMFALAVTVVVVGNVVSVVVGSGVVVASVVVASVVVASVVVLILSKSEHLQFKVCL